MSALFAGDNHVGRRGTLALIAITVAWMVLGAARAEAEIILGPETVGAGSVTTFGGDSPPYGGCDRTANQNDRELVNCPGATIATQQQCPAFFCIPVPSTLVLTATPAPNPPGHWRFVRWDNCPGFTGGNNTCSMTNPTVRAFYRPRAIFDDTLGPTMTGLATNFSTTVDRGVNFIGVSANEDLAAPPDCSVDGGAFAPCSTVRQFAEGSHSVRAQGVDQSGNVGTPSGTLATFRVLDTNIESGPPAFTNNKNPSVTYSTGAGAGVTFECSLNGAAFAACNDGLANGRATKAFSNQADGDYSLRVRSTDPTSFDRVPAVRSWRVDTVAPVSTLTSATITDGIVTTALSATFTFGSTDAGGLDRVECSVDGAAFEPCTSPRTLNDLAFGAHSFSVRGVDKAGNVGDVQMRNWTVAARDNDGDGFNQRSDCNDDDPRINPIAPDAPENGVDENCDGADTVNLDRDGDLFARPGDCNDANPAIRPGVPDIPDNGIDENCDGSDTKTPPPARIGATVTYSYAAPGKSTRFTKFQVKNLPAGSTVTAKCKGRACGKKPVKFTKRNVQGSLSIAVLKRSFKAGSTLEIRVTKTGMEGIVKLIKVRKNKAPALTSRCLKVGSTTPTACT